MQGAEAAGRLEGSGKGVIPEEGTIQNWEGGGVEDGSGKSLCQAVARAVQRLKRTSCAGERIGFCSSRNSASGDHGRRGSEADEL